MSDIATYESKQPIDNFKEVVDIIRQKRNELLRTANKTLIETYWQVGKYISDKISASSWGDGVVKQLATYISYNAPDLKGFSDKNLWRMKRFYDLYHHDEKLSPLVREISWTHNLLIMSRCDGEIEREFYIRLAIRDNLTKRELDRQIDASVFERSMLSHHALSSMPQILPAKAGEVLRDHYVMEYITGREAKPENSLRRALLKHMKEFVLELGRDFIPMGEEFRVQVGMTDFRIDLLFFHRELQCLVAIELKTRKFKPGIWDNLISISKPLIEM